MTEPSMPAWMDGADAVKAAARAFTDAHNAVTGSDVWYEYGIPFVDDADQAAAIAGIQAALPLIAEREEQVRAEERDLAADELRRVRHDLEHVVVERDRAQAEVRRVRKEERERIAEDIRNELVCCDIYDQLADFRSGGTRRGPSGDSEFNRLVGAHRICYWGEASARLAENHAVAMPRIGKMGDDRA